MMTKMLRTIEGWRFELPLALLLALSVGFAMFAMPEAMVDAIPGAINLGPLLRPVLGAAAAVIGGLLALGVMLKAGGGRPVRRTPASVYVDAEGAEHPFDMAFRPIPAEPVVTPPAEPTVRVRRADAHPDAPPRAPILATRDLGEPFMDYGAPAPAASRAIPDGDYVELPAALEDEAIARFAPETVAETAEADEVPAAVWEADAGHAETEEPQAAEPVATEPADIAEPALSPDPVPEPSIARTARPERQSISDMMARLDAGLGRRNGRSQPPRDARPALRDALAELNRLAARRS